jgi:ubiquinone/menaquinone biosynthesis C-methylase UbiE
MAAEYAALAQAFDTIAPDYDAVYGSNPLMNWMRRESLAMLEATFAPGTRLLEIGCGTGEEAIHMGRRGCSIHAIDVSPAMVEITAQKAHDVGLSEHITAEVIPAGGLSQTTTSNHFNGAYASFGALNCEPDLMSMANALGKLLNPGAHFVCSVMAKVCPFEIGWYMLHGKPREAFRRFRPGWQNAGVAGADGLRTETSVRYLTAPMLQKAFSPLFRIKQVIGFPVLLPPPYLDHLYKRHDRLWARIESAERGMRSVWPFSRMGDHILVMMQRV